MTTSTITSKYVEHFLSILIPTCKLGNYWPSRMTIMMRMTSKMIKDIVDNAQPPTTVNLIWSIYKTNIIKINSTIRCLNIIDLTITEFDNTNQGEDWRYEKNDADDILTDSADDILTAGADDILTAGTDDIKSTLLKLSEMISLNKKLTKLDLSSCGLHNNCLKYLKKSFKQLKDLSNINLHDNNLCLSLDFIKILLSLPKLVSLNLDENTRIWNIDTDDWNLNPEQTLQLENLSLGFCNIDENADNIFELIRKSPKLRSLDLRENYLDDNSMNQFIESLGQCPNLTDLDISDNRIEDELMKTLLEYLEQHHNLSNLDISGNIDWNYDEEYEGYKNFKAYIDSLKSTCTITMSYLQENGL